MGSSLLFCLPSVAFLAIFEVLPLIFFESHHLLFIRFFTLSPVVWTRFSKPYFDMRWVFLLLLFLVGVSITLNTVTFRHG